MKRIYYVLIKGKGEGCDYTIGCNLQWRKIEVEPEELTKKLKEIWEDYIGTGIEEMTLLSVNRIMKLPVETFEREHVEAKIKEKAQEEEEKEKVEYERLKAKFEG